MNDTKTTPVDAKWPTGLDPRPYAEALERVEADAGCRAAVAEGYVRTVYRMTPDSKHWAENVKDVTEDISDFLKEYGLALIALQPLIAALKSRSMTIDENSEDGLFDFSCPRCGQSATAMQEGAEYAPVFGAATVFHYGEESSRCPLYEVPSDERYPARVAALLKLNVGQDAPLDFEMVRLERMFSDGGQWLIPDIMERGTLTGLFGPPKTGKSLLALQWAADLAKTGSRVIYLDEENPSFEVGARLESMGYEPRQLRNLSYYSFTGWSVDTEEGAAKILDTARGADLVVFDSWAKFFVSGSQSDDATANRAYRLVLKPLRAAGVSVIRLDHTGHDESRRPAGSVQKLADVDHNWMVRAKRVPSGQPVPVTLTHTENRTGRGADVISMIREVSPTTRHVIVADLSEVTSEPESSEEDAPSEAVVKSRAVVELVRMLDDMSIPIDWDYGMVDAAIQKKTGKGRRKANVLAAMEERRRQPTS